MPSLLPLLPVAYLALWAGGATYLWFRARRGDPGHFLTDDPARYTTEGRRWHRISLARGWAGAAIFLLLLRFF